MSLEKIVSSSLGDHYPVSQAKGMQSVDPTAGYVELLEGLDDDWKQFVDPSKDRTRQAQAFYSEVAKSVGGHVDPLGWTQVLNALKQEGTSVEDYKALYFSYNPNASEADFKKALTTFSQGQQFFIPAASLGEWQISLHNAAIENVTGILKAAGTAEKSTNIMEVVGLIIELLSKGLLPLGLAQVQMAQKYTEWSRALQQMKQELQPILKGDKDSKNPLSRLDGEGKDPQADMRIDANKLISQKLEGITAQINIVGNIQKGLQTALAKNTESVQMTHQNISTFLQTIMSCVNAIYK
jgi:hypothetical protein